MPLTLTSPLMRIRWVLSMVGHLNTRFAGRKLAGSRRGEAPRLTPLEFELRSESSEEYLESGMGFTGRG